MTEFNWAMQEDRDLDLPRYIVDKKAVSSSPELYYRSLWPFFGSDKGVKLAEYMIQNGILPTQKDLDGVRELLHQNSFSEDDNERMKKLIAMFETSLKANPNEAKSAKFGKSIVQPISEEAKKIIYTRTNEKDSSGKYIRKVNSIPIRIPTK